jgi:hypothetical protein
MWTLNERHVADEGVIGVVTDHFFFFGFVNIVVQSAGFHLALSLSTYQGPWNLGTNTQLSPGNHFHQKE